MKLKMINRQKYSVCLGTETKAKNNKNIMSKFENKISVCCMKIFKLNTVELPRCGSVSHVSTTLVLYTLNLSEGTLWAAVHSKHVQVHVHVVFFPNVDQATSTHTM